MFNPEILHSELVFKAVRSSGKGGQHVNKVSSKVELYFDITKSLVLSEEEKKILLEKLANRINSEGMLMVDSQESRSQYRNKKIATGKFDELITKAFIKKKVRLKTKPSKSAEAKRLDSKKKNAIKKQLRNKRFDL